MKFKSSFQRRTTDAIGSFWMVAWIHTNLQHYPHTWMAFWRKTFWSVLWGWWIGDWCSLSHCLLMPVIWRRQKGNWIVHTVAGASKLSWHEAEGGRFYKKLVSCRALWCPQVNLLLVRCACFIIKKCSPPDALIRSVCCFDLYKPNSCIHGNATVWQSSPPQVPALLSWQQHAYI